MPDEKAEKQSKRTLSYLIGTAILLVVMMAVALFLLFNWARIGLEVQEMREESQIKQEQSTP